MGFLEVVKEKKLLIPQIQSYLTALFSGQKQENRIEIWSDYSPSSIGYTVNSFFKEKIEEEKLQDIEKFLRMLSEQIPFSVLQTSLQEEAVWGAEVEQISTKISAPEQNSVEKLMHSAPLEALAQATNNSGEGVKDILEKAKGLFEEVQNYLQDTQTGAVKKGGGSFSFLQTSIRLIESVSTAFGMGNFFQVAGNSMQSQSVPQQLMTVAAFFGMVALTCAPSLANSAGKGLVIGSLIGLGALSLLWFFLKPLPTSLPHAAWWSTAVRPEEGFIQLKKQTLDVLAQALRSFSHPLLVENAEGSNHLTLKAFLHAVKRGDYPFLQEKRFFYLNMQEILTHNEAYAILHNIARTMGRGRKKIVLILDKCEALFTKPGSAAELCKSFLEKEGKFPHVIGLTQQKNYATSIEPYMLFLPFQRIDIETASKEETLKFVLSFLLKEPFSKPLIEERALEYLYQASVERGQFQPLGT